MREPLISRIKIIKTPLAFPRRPKLGPLPSLNTQSCIKGLFVDFCFWAVWAARPVHKKKLVADYRIVASTSPSCIEAHAGLFRSLMKGIFDPYVL